VNRRADFSKFSSTDAILADIKNKSVRGAVFVATSSAIDIVLRFVAIAILARLLLPEDFGLIAMVAAITGVVDSVRDLGLSTATVQRREITHPQVTNLFWLNTAIGGVFTLVFVGLAPLIARFYSDDRLIGVAAALSLVFLWSGLTVQHEALMSRQLRQGELAAIRLLASVFSTLLAVALALGDFGYWALVWREVARSAFIAAGVWLCCPWRPGIPIRHVGTGSLLRFGGELSATNVLAGLIGNIDKLLIGRMFGAAPVGLYRQAQQLLLAPIEQFNGPILSVGQPALSALQSDPGRYRRYYEKIVFLVTLMTLPVGLFVAVYAREVTLFLLGPEWTEATVFVRIFGILAMIRPASGTSGVVLITCGLSTRFLALAAVHGVVLVAFLLIGVGWGAVGVAMAQLATTVTMLVPKLYYSFLRTPASLGGFFRAIRGPFIAGLVMAAGLSSLRSVEPVDDVLLSMLAGASAGAALYLGVLWLLPGSRVEIKSLVVDVRAALQRRRGDGIAQLR